MNFTQIFDDANYQILKSWSGSTIFQNERNYFKVVLKNIAAKNSFKFNGYTYFGYFNNDSVIIEVTDIVRSGSSPITFTFYNDVNAVLHTITCSLISGIAQNSITKINLPSEIKVDFALLATHSICSTDNYEKKTGASIVSENFGTISAATNYVKQNDSYIKITQFDSCDSILFRWLSANGYQKDWYLLQDKLNFLSDKSLQLETGGSDYNIFKNKKVKFSVVERQADLSTQKYLSDLVLSDDVKVFIDGQWLAIEIDTNSIEISTKRKDLVFNVNFQHYDTI